MFFFFSSLQCTILFESISSRRVDYWRRFIDNIVMTVSVTMNSGGLQGGFYGAVWLKAFLLRLVTLNSTI